MKITLIQPPVRDFYQTHDRMEPLGLEYIAASLQSAGHQVTLINANLSSSSSSPLPIPNQLAYMNQFYHPDDLSPFRLFTHYQHFGMSFEEMADQAASSQPDLIGISANFTPYEEEALACAKTLKNKLPSIPIVLGGHHATIQARELMQHSFIDFIIRGEGEISMPLLAQTLQSVAWASCPCVPPQLQASLTKIPGLLFRDSSGRITENPLAPPINPIELLPKPIRSPQPTQMVLTSRGCPRHCRFCSIAHVMGSKLRLRPIPDIIEEIEEAIRDGARHIDFEDDNMNWDKARMLQLMDALATIRATETTKTAETPLPLNSEPQATNSQSIRFSARNGLVAEKLDAQILQRMADAGFERINLAVVSANPSLQEQLERNQPISRFEETVHLARAAGLKVTAYLILGLPTDTLDEMIRNILWLAKLPVEIGPSIFYPVPGTPLFDFCVQRDYIDPKNKPAFRSSAYPVETENFTRNDLVTLMRICRLLNFIKNDEPLSSQTLKKTLDQDRPLSLQFEATTQQHAACNTESTSCYLQLTASSRLDRKTIGAYLIQRFLGTGRLLGLRYRKRRKQPYIYEEIDYGASDRITQPFLQALSILSE